LQVFLDEFGVLLVDLLRRGRGSGGGWWIGLAFPGLGGHGSGNQGQRQQRTTDGSNAASHKQVLSGDLKSDNALRVLVSTSGVRDLRRGFTAETLRRGEKAEERRP
jgi:hypothetical protein